MTHRPGPPPTFDDGSRAPWHHTPQPPPAANPALPEAPRSAKQPSQRGWRHLLYALTRINVGQSPDELYEIDLHSRIRRNPHGSYQIGVVGVKGGVGRTSVTATLGSVLGQVRGDGVLAVDADPHGGNLVDRTGRQTAATIADLLAATRLTNYNDVRSYTSMTASNLEVLSALDYSTARREFCDAEWERLTTILSHYYILVLADCGAGLFGPAARAVLSTVSALVIVASASVDGARQAAVTLNWLRQNGYHSLLEHSCVVINHLLPGKPAVDVADLAQQFERFVRPGRVVNLPWDKHIAAGAEIEFDALGNATRRRILELAAVVSDDFGAAPARDQRPR